ncbi:hypothetical protein [Enterobacter phage 04_vB_Eclo_IJM]|nr:hypothetical protein [Enterobacter phage 04_vB_Eclo_IJM]
MKPLGCLGCLRVFCLTGGLMAVYIPLNANDDLDAIDDMLAAIGEPQS